MKTVFVHGAPNGPDIWSGLISELHLLPENCCALALPGFSVPCGDDFEPGREAYADWLIDRVDDIVSASGEPVRVGSHVCVVARADKGQVMAIGIVECATNQELETDEKGDMFNGTMSMEDEALITAWLKHVAHAVSHFETLKTCVDGMSEASEALVALQNQLEEVQSTSKERTISIHRYHTAATAGEVDPPATSI